MNLWLTRCREQQKLCLDTCAWTPCLQICSWELAWEPLLGNLAWEPVLGNLSLETYSGEPCLETCLGNLFLKTLLGDLACEPVLGNLAWKPVLGTLAWQPGIGTLAWKPFLGNLAWEPLLGNLAWEPLGTFGNLGNLWESLGIFGNLAWTSSWKPLGTLLGNWLRTLTWKPALRNLLMGTFGSLLGNLAWEPLPGNPRLGTSSWEPWLGTLRSADLAAPTCSETFIMAENPSLPCWAKTSMTSWNMLHNHIYIYDTIWHICIHNNLYNLYTHIISKHLEVWLVGSGDQAKGHLHFEHFHFVVLFVTNLLVRVPRKKRVFSRKLLQN